MPLVRALGEAVAGPAAAHVHRGATSQDVLDSAAMLVAHRALGPLLADLRAAAAAAAALAEAHRETPMAGRTLLQQALPMTFGLKAATWLVGLDEAGERLATVRSERLAVQLGGAAGTLAALGGDGIAVLGLLARELGLAEPVLPWHTTRTRPAELAGALGVAAGAIAKVATDVVLLAQTEVGEVREGVAGRGGSSTLPHKRNPVAATCARACAMRAPGLVATLLGAMAHEHERAAGAWHAEWRPLADLLTATGLGRGLAARLPRAPGGRRRADALEPRPDRRRAAGRARDRRAGARARPSGRARPRRAGGRRGGRRRAAAGRGARRAARGPRAPRARRRSVGCSSRPTTWAPRAG